MGYAHCDIKPNNILRNDKRRGEGDRLRPELQDRHGQGAHPGHARLHRPRAGARRPISVQTDVFNLGATLYWALTGKHIPTLYTVNKKGENSFLLDTRIDTPMDLNPKVPPAVSNLVMECVSTKQQKRPADMDEVINRLELRRHILQKQVPTPST